MVYKRALIIGAFLSVLIAPSFALAASTTFSQKILPMDCVFEVINDGAGTLYYVTPAACGVIVNPPPAESGTSTPAIAGTSGTPISAIPGQFYSAPQNASVIDLGQLSSLSQRVITFDAKVGQIYSFTITADSSNKLERHHLMITSIDLSDKWHPRITVIVHSNVNTLTLTRGQTARAELDNDNDLEFYIKADYIKADRANLSIWQAEKMSAATNTSQRYYSAAKIWYLTATGLIILAGYLLYKKLRLP